MVNLTIKSTSSG